ncbi:MAG: AsmA-like C-terminal domain-containing protein [Rickettsiales bacterium]
MQNKILRFLLGALLGLTVWLLIVFNFLLIWVATGPRSFDMLTPYIEDALSATDGSYKVKIGKTHLIWDGWRHPVDIRLSSVALLTENDQLFTTLPEVSVDLSVPYLAIGRVIPKSLTISAPFMNLIRNDKRNFDFSFSDNKSIQSTDSNNQQNSESMSFSKIFKSFFSGDSADQFHMLRKVIIYDAGLRIGNSRTQSFFDARNCNMILIRDKDGKVRINGNANIRYGDYDSNIYAELDIANSSSQIKGKFSFSKLMPNILGEMFFDSLDVRAFAVPVSGNANISLDMDGNIKSAKLSLDGGKGSIKSENFISEIPVNSIKLDADFTENLSRMNVNELKTDISGANFSADGFIILDHDKNENNDKEADSIAIKLDIEAKDIPAKNVKLLWPPSLSPMSREWITENMTGGKITSAKVSLNIKKGEMEEQELAKDSIDANISIKDFNVRYLPEHPKLRKVRGDVHVDGKTLTADIKSANFLDKTILSDGKVTIDDLNADNPYIKVSLNAQSPSDDMVYFLSLPRLKHSKRLGLDKRSQGSVKGYAEIGFNFFSPKGVKAEDAISYDITADLFDISQPEFLRKFDIENANGKMAVNNDGVEFSGAASVNGAKVKKGKVKYLFATDKSGVDTFLDFTGGIEKKYLTRFGYPDFPFISGYIGIDAKMRLGKDIENTEASLDLKRANLDLKDIGLKKPLSIPATLKLKAKKQKNDLNVEYFNLKSRDIDAKGTAILAGKSKLLAEVKTSKLVYGKNIISKLDYKNRNGMMYIDVTADSVDFIPFLGGDEVSEKKSINKLNKPNSAKKYIVEDSGGFSFMNFPAMRVRANIKKFILWDGRFLENLKGYLNCDKTICTEANFKGMSGESKPFTFNIFKDSKGKRSLAIRSEDAGSLLYVLNIIDSMKGGKLFVDAKYQENGKNSILDGRLYISDYVVKDAPILGKVLSLASLSGLIDTLSGKGIIFKKVNMPFILHNDIISIKDAKTYGSSLGITINGTITFPAKELDIKGVIVPSYSTNNLIGKIPLLGSLLVGKEGEGVFAARYNIKGKEKDANISVNPLSILAPGFLRRLFDIFD